VCVCVCVCVRVCVRGCVWCVCMWYAFNAIAHVPPSKAYRLSLGATAAHAFNALWLASRGAVMMRSPALPAALAGAIELTAAAGSIVALVYALLVHGVLGAAYKTVQSEYNGLWGAIGAARGGSGDAAAAAAADAAAAVLWKGADAAEDAAACAASEVAYAALLGAAGGSAGASLATGVTAALVADRTGLYTALGRVVDDYDGKGPTRWVDVAAPLLEAPPVALFVRVRVGVAAIGALGCGAGAVLRAGAGAIVSARGARARRCRRACWD
jgi:hypothetical protein